MCDKTVEGWRFVNVGSARKPKDGDPHGCWALLDTALMTPRGRAAAGG
ncbi:MAG: hypothetical protein ACYDAN_12730 [Candidatus Limnocylindrales bacterium]